MAEFMAVLKAKLDGSGVRAGAQEMKKHLQELKDQARASQAALGQMTLNPGRFDADAIKGTRQGLSETKQKIQEVEQALDALGEKGHRAAKKLSTLQIWAAFAGAREMVKEPLAAIAGLSEGTQKVIDKSTGMAVAGFSAFQTLGTGAGLAGAGVMAVVGALMAAAARTEEFRKKIEENTKAFDRMRDEAHTANEAISFTQALSSIQGLSDESDKMWKEMHEVWTGGLSLVASSFIEVFGGGDTSIAAQFARAQAQLKMQASFTSADIARSYLEMGTEVRRALTEAEIATSRKGRSLTELKERYEAAKKKGEEFAARSDELAKIQQSLAAGFAQASASGGSLAVTMEMLSKMGIDPERMKGGLETFVVSMLGRLKIDGKEAAKIQKELAETASEYGSKLKEMKDPFDELMKKLRQANDVAGGKLDIFDAKGLGEENDAIAETYSHIIDLKYQGRKLTADEKKEIHALVQETAAWVKDLEAAKKVKEVMRSNDQEISKLRDQLVLTQMSTEEAAKQAMWYDAMRKAKAEGRQLSVADALALKDQTDDVFRLTRLIGVQGILREKREGLEVARRELGILDLTGAALQDAQLTEQALAFAKGKGLKLREGELELLKEILHEEKEIAYAKASKQSLRDAEAEVSSLRAKLGIYADGVVAIQSFEKSQQVVNSLMKDFGYVTDEDKEKLKILSTEAARLEKELGRPLRQFIADSEELWTNLESAGVGAIDQLNSAWIEWLKGGEFSLESFSNYVIEEVTKITAKYIQAQIAASLLEKSVPGQQSANAEASATTAVVGAASSAASASLSGREASEAQAAAASAWAAVAVGAATQAGGGAGQVGGKIADGFLGEDSALDELLGIGTEAATQMHSGGYTNSSGGARRSISAAILARAPRMKMGGMVNGERAIVAHDDEAVVPLGAGRRIPVEIRGGAGGGSPVINVTFHIHSNNPDSFRKSQAQVEQMAVNTFRRAYKRA